MDIRKHRKPRRLISLTPLIDVVFILLVFFMISSNYQKWRHLPLESEASGHSAENTESILLRLKPHSLDVNGQVMTPDELSSFIKRQLEVTPDLHVWVQPGRQVVLQRTVDVLDRMAADGVQSVSLTR